MVKRYSLHKIKVHLKGGIFLAITIVVIANLVFGNIVFAKTFKVSNEDVEKIKTALDLVKTFFNIVIDNETLKTILNLAIRGGEMSTDVTYGLLVLSTLNEIELIDLVISQRYKIEARKYFDNILNERLNLFSYWKKIGPDLPRVLSGQITSPMTALTLNTFSITNKVIEIFIAFENLKKIKLYDGLWVYFDLRKQGNESHKIAWEEARWQMQWAGTSELESQFANLYDKWNPYVTSYGINEEAKTKIKDGLRTTLAEAIETYRLAEREQKPSLTEKIKSSWQELIKKLEKLKTLVEILKHIPQAVRGMAEKFLAAIKSTFFSQSSSTPEPEKVTQPKEIMEVRPPYIGEGEPELNELREEINNLTERMDALNQQLTKLLETGSPPTELPEQIEEELEEIEEELEKIDEEEQIEEESKEEFKEMPEELAQPQEEATVIICEISSSNLPAKNKVIFNEIAWMGTENSANDEWIELKNISNTEVDLAGWQLLDKNQQIKIIFTEGEPISPNGFYLLERTDDSSVPEITADFIYTGVLNNTDESLYLFDQNCQLQDKVEANPNWPAGNNFSKKTMERKTNLSWQTSRYIGGTPKTENSMGEITYSGGPTPTSSSSAEEESSSSPPPKVLITEVQIESTDSSNYDFIELYNLATDAADISGFQLKKKSSTGKEYSIRLFPEGSIIFGKSYFLWVNSDYANQIPADVTSTQTLAKNNSLALLDRDKNIIDAVAWGSSTNPFVEGIPFSQHPDQDKTLGRKWSTTTEGYIDTDNNSEDFEIQIPTPKEKNEPAMEGAEGGNEEGGDEEGERGERGEERIESGEGEKFEQLSLNVVINEIGWMGTKSSSTDEWIELFNNTTSTIDITGWKLISSDGSPDIIFSTSSIPAQGFYLIERKTEKKENFQILDQYLKPMADLLTSFSRGLSNKNCEKLSLYDQKGNLIDETGCLENGSWPAGEASPNYISMERIDPNSSGMSSENWANNNLLVRNGFDIERNRINGTPKSENSVSKSFTLISGTLSFNDFDELVLLSEYSPYLAEGRIIIPKDKTLIIEPGVIIKFRQSYRRGSGMEIEGTLLAGETEKDPVVFTSIYDKDYAPELIPDKDRDPQPGDWDWLHFKESFGSELENLILRYGGRYYFSSTGSFPSFTKGTIQIENGEIKIKNSRIEKSYTHGLWLMNSSSTIEGVEFLDIGFGNFWQPVALLIGGETDNSIIKNSIFKGNEIGIFIKTRSKFLIERNLFEENQIPIQTNNLLGTFSGNIAKNNKYNGILLTGLGFSLEITEINWQNANLPFVIENVISIPFGTTLNLEPGAIIKFSNGSLRIEGTLKAIGNSEEKIVFTSIHDDQFGGDTNNNGTSTQGQAGHWRSIIFAPSSTDSILDNVIVRYGGWHSWWRGPGAFGGAIKVIDAPIKILNSIIEKNLFAGVELNNSTSIIENTIFRDHRAKFNYRMGKSSALYLINSSPIISNSQFQNNYYAIYKTGNSQPIIEEDSVVFEKNTYDIYPIPSP